jgi:hypothetical protein
VSMEQNMKAMQRQSRALCASTFLAICCLPPALSQLIGCSSEPSPSDPQSFSARQQAALNDPMGYKVPQSPDVSDNNTTSMDKPGFKRDLDDVLNP